MKVNLSRRPLVRATPSRQFDMAGAEDRTMTRLRLLSLATGIAAAVALGGCYTPPPGTSGEAVDYDYGISPNPVPKDLMRPDGLMINGLLPPNPNEGS
jgi:hypothetical protein